MAVAGCLAAATTAAKPAASARRGRVAAAGCLAILLAACGGTAAAPSAPTSAASRPAASEPPSSAAASAGAASAKPATSAAGSAAAGGSGLHIDMANSSLSGDAIPLWVARDGGYFQKNGLDVNIQLISGAAASMSTLLSGKVQFGNLGGSAVLTSAAGGADTVILASNSPVMPYKLYVPADIKTAADLKGKKVDLGTIGSAVDVATKIGLRQLGLDPDKDVVYVTTGSHSAATAALMNGAIQARMDNPPGSVELDARGFHPLLDMAAQKIPAANSTLVVTRGYLNGHRDVAQKFVDSMVQASARARSDKAFVVKELEKEYKSSDQAAMEAAYDFWVNEVIQPLPFARPDQFTDTKNDLARQNPKVADVDVAKLLDTSFVQSAADRGLDKASA
jgi:ABC-type nitrate/sulfonate/bicarbonate transport system substrate-binding protein